MLKRLTPYFFVFIASLSHFLSAAIVNEKGEVLSDVIAIFECMKPLMSEEDRILLKSPSIENLNTIAQKQFLRPAGLERRDIIQKDSVFAPYATPGLALHFKAIGDIDSIFPSRKTYDYILFNGATLQVMRNRLATLIDLIQNHALSITNSTQIILLVGERDLFERETRSQLLDPSPLIQDPSWTANEVWPSTESEAADWIFKQTLLPACLRQAKIVLVKAPKNKKVDALGSVTYSRPTTQDTVKSWVQQHNPSPGICLSISSQPFVYYQDVTIRNCLANLHIKGFEIEGAGYDSMDIENFDKNLPVYLDNLARTIYSELQLKKVNLAKSE